MNFLKSICFLSLIALTMNTVSGQELKAFQLYDKQGAKTDFYSMTKKLASYDVVLFGEIHNNAINHWLQLRVAKELYNQKQEDLILGAEMMERDQQTGIDSLLQGAWDQQQFQDSLQLWSNFTTDYWPLLKFSKEHHLKFIATNVPRRFARLVARNGVDTLEALSENDHSLMAAVPFQIDMTAPGYKEMKSMMADHAGMHMNANYMVAAQALKDVTMAESILENLKDGKLLLHFNGDYHSRAQGGIYWYLKQKAPELKVAVISVFETDKPDLVLPKKQAVLEGQKQRKTKLATFNLVLPKDMNKSY